MRKKYSKIFSIFAIVLAAFLLFGSVSTFKTVKADNAPKTYSKSVTVDTIKNLATKNTPIESGDYYVEFGEYPQSRIDDTASATIQTWINELKNDYGKNPSAPIVSNRNFSKNDGTKTDKNMIHRITYDATTGYYTLLQAVSGENGKVYPIGTKVHEYISGVDAATKYPVYKFDTNGNEKVVANMSGSVGQSVRGGVIFSRMTSDSQSYVTGIDTSNGYAAGTSYLFEVEPIKWRIYQINTDGTMLLQSDLILDSMSYNLYSSNGTYYGSSYLYNWLTMTSGETGTYNPINMANNNTYSYYQGEEIKTAEGLVGQFLFDDADKALKGTSTKSTQEYRSDANNKTSNYTIYKNGTHNRYLKYDNYAYFRSFYDMAFDANEKSLMKTQSVTHSGYVNWTPSQSGTVQAKVTIPDLRSTAQGFRIGTSGNGAYSEYALATGLVAGYDGYYLDNRPSNTQAPTYDITKAGEERTYGFVWAMHANRFSGTGSVDFTGASTFILNAGDDKVVQLQQPGQNEALMPYWTGTSQNTAYYYKQHNTYGVLPQIKVNINDLLGTDGFEIKANGTTNGLVETGEAVNESDRDFGIDSEALNYADLTTATIANKSELFVQRMSSTATTTDEIVVKSFKMDRSGANHKLKIVFSVGNQYDNGYIRVVYNNGTVPTSKTYGDCTYLTSGKVHTFAIPDVEAVNGNRYVSMEIDFGAEKISDGFTVSAYAVSSNERLIKYITGSEISSYSMSIFKTNESKNAASTRVLFEGESYTFAHKETTGASGNHTQNWYYKGTSTAFTSQPAGNDATSLLNAGYTIYASRTGLCYGNDIPLQHNEFYTDYEGSPFGVRINEANTGHVTNFLYVVEGTHEDSAEIALPGNGLTLMDGSVGQDITLTVRIRNPFINKAQDIVERFTVSVKENNVKRALTKDVNYTVDEGYIYFPALGNAERVVKEYYYSVTIRGENTQFTGQEGTPNAEGQYDGADYNYVVLETNITTADVDLVKEDTYQIDEATAEINFVGVKANGVVNGNGVRLDESEKLDNKTRIHSIQYNNDITTQINLNTGYYVSIENNTIAMPEMTFQYNAIVVDENNYRMSETAKYPSNYVSKLYADSNIRVNKNGYELAFDAKDNLIYNDDRYVLTNNGGIYQSETKVWYIPTFTLYSSHRLTGIDKFTSKIFTLDQDAFVDSGYTTVVFMSGDDKLVFNAEKDTWTYTSNDGTNDTIETCNLTISRDIKNPVYCADDKNNGKCFYLVADYYTAYDTTQGLDFVTSKLCQYDATDDASYMYVLNTDADKVKPGIQIASLDSALTPVNLSAKAYNPWVERISANVNTTFTVVQADYDNGIFTGKFNTGGLTDSGFDWQYKMWYFVDANGQTIQLSQRQGANGLELYYGSAVASIGDDGNRYIEYNGAPRRVFSVNGITADITYFLEEKTCSQAELESLGFINVVGRKYYQNEIIIMLNIDNVVSDVEFNFTGAEAYEYEVAFTSNFGVTENGTVTTEWANIAGYGESFNAVKVFNYNNVDHKVFTINTSTIQDSGRLTDNINLNTYNAVDADTREFTAINMKGRDGKDYQYFLAPYAVVADANGSADTATTYIQYTGSNILQFVGWELKDTTALTEECKERWEVFAAKYANEHGYLDMQTIINGGADETTGEVEAFKWEFINTFASLEFVAVYFHLEFSVQLQAWEPNRMTDAIEVATNGEPSEDLFKLVTIAGEDGRQESETEAYSLKRVRYSTPINIGNNPDATGYNAGMVLVNDYYKNVDLTFGEDILMRDYASYKGWYYANSNTSNNAYLRDLNARATAYNDVIAYLESKKVANSNDKNFLEVYLWGDTSNKYYKFNTTGAGPASVADAYVKVVQNGDEAIITWYSKFIFDMNGEPTSTKIYKDMVLTAVFETKMYTLKGLSDNYGEDNGDIFVGDENNAKQILMGQNTTLIYYVSKRYSKTEVKLSDFIINDTQLSGSFTLYKDDFAISGTAVISATTRTYEYTGYAFNYNTYMITINLQNVMFDIDIKFETGVDYSENDYTITFPAMKNATNTSGTSYNYGTFESTDTVTQGHYTNYTFSFVRHDAFSQSYNLNNALQIKLPDGTIIPVNTATATGFCWNSGQSKYCLNGLVEDVEIQFADTTAAGTVDWQLNSYVVTSEQQMSTVNADKYYNVDNKNKSVVYGDSSTIKLSMKEAYNETIPTLVVNNRYVLFFVFNLTYNAGNKVVVNYRTTPVEITKNTEAYSYVYSLDGYTYTISSSDNGANYVYTITKDAEAHHEISVSYSTAASGGYEYQVTFINTTYSPNAYLLGAFNVDSTLYADSEYVAREGWVRNVYDVTVPFETKDANTVIIYTVKGYDKKNSNAEFAVTNGNKVVRIYHGDTVEFKLTMGAAYTQSLPVFMVNGVEVSLVDCEASEVVENAKANAPTEYVITYTHTSGLQVVLTYTLDETFNGDSFAEIIANNSYINEGLFAKYQYVTANYSVDFDVFDDTEVTVKYYYYNTNAYKVNDDARLNQYVVAYHKGINDGRGNYEDNGSLYYNKEGALTTQETIWKTFYYEIYSHDALIVNPFDISTPGTVGYAFQNDIEGHKYADQAKWFTIKNNVSEQFEPTTAKITSNTILVAPYVEETYNATTVKLTTAAEQGNATYRGASDGYDYSNFGKLSVNYTATTWKNKASEADVWTQVTSSDLTFNGVKFGKTDLLKVRMQMYAAYDQSTPYFVVSKYGVILYPGTQGYDVSSYGGYYYYKPFASFATYATPIKYTINNVEKEFIYIKVTTSGNSTVYTYYSSNEFNNTDKLFAITITPENGKRDNSTAVTMTYTLEFLRKVDAGEPIDSQINPAGDTFKVNVDTSKITKLNEYTVTYKDLVYTREYDNSYGTQFAYNQLTENYSVYSGSGDGRDIPSISYAHGTDFTHLVKYNQAITGYGFVGWFESGASTATFASRQDDKTMYYNLELYAQFKALTNSVVYHNGQGEFYIQNSAAAGLEFGSFANTISGAPYIGADSEQKIRFNLGEAFTRYDQLKFRLLVNDNGTYRIIEGSDTEDTQAYFKSVYKFNSKTGEGYYEISVKYLRTQLYVTLDFDNIETSLEDIYTSNIDKYTVTVYTGLNYTSGYTDALKFTETYEFASATKEPQVFENIRFNTSIKETEAYATVSLPLLEQNGWNFVGFYIAGIEENDAYDMAVSWYQNEEIETGDTYGDKFSVNYKITSDLFVYPYFTRTVQTVTVVETCLENDKETGMGLLREYHEGSFSYVFQVKFGQSLYSDDDNRYRVEDEFVAVINDMQSATDYKISHYTFAGVKYLPVGTSFDSANISDFLTYENLFYHISSQDMVIYLDFVREVYDITLVENESTQANLLAGQDTNYPIDHVEVVNGIVKVPYGATIPEEIAELALLNYNIPDGSHFEDWVQVGNESNRLSGMIVSENLSFKPYTTYNVFNFIVDATSGTAISYINNEAVSVKDGDPVTPNFGQNYSIGFVPNTGYDMYAPTVEIWINGVQKDPTQIAVSDDKVFTISYNDRGDSRVYNIVFPQGTIGGELAHHGTVIEVRIIGTINTYIMETFNAHDLDFGVGNNNAVRTAVLEANDPYAPTVWTYVYNSLVIAEFSSIAAPYGGSYTLVLRLNKRYSEKSTFVFTLSAGTSSYTHTLAPSTAPIREEDGYNIYEFALGNVREAVVFTMSESTELRINEYTIKFEVYYGGGVNGWHQETALYNFYDLKVESEAAAVAVHDFDYNPKYNNYTLAAINGQYGWVEAKQNVNVSTLTAADINKNNFVDFNANPGVGGFTHNITVYAFFIVGSTDVSVSTTPDSSKGNLVYTDKADKNDGNNNTVAGGYRFSYEMSQEYTQNIPVITMAGNGNFDFVLVSEEILNSMSVNDTKEAKTSVVTYTVTRTANGYTYALANALGALDEYTVVIEAGNYNFKNGAQEIAVAQNTGSKFTVEVLTVSENFTLAVNDSKFTINQYTITFKHVGGETEVETVTHGSSVVDVPSDTVNFIQKLVYVVTFADGTEQEFSAEEFDELTFTGNATVEIKAVLNMGILIPIVVGAVLIIVVIVVLIVKGSKGKAEKTRSGKSNEAMFDKLNQAKAPSQESQAAEAPKAAAPKKKAYNPYLDNKKDNNQQ